MSAGSAALTVSGYWVALLVGRLLLGPVADRCGAHLVLRAALATTVTAAVLLLLPGRTATAGIVLLGLAAAPMFPLLILTTGERVHADSARARTSRHGPSDPAPDRSRITPTVAGTIAAPAAEAATWMPITRSASTVTYAVATRSRPSGG
ncbi:hypothetical protein [Plantactinospora sp. BB1]|uniref:hypothetical protein n=1 Tax=Plantactinospora sp. BB1 TaxID=2071627 RepID=UPI000D162C7A|nr:hypothetical protein [Plantactinospora sp. BB1]AVT36547.1 hypothetical protein C6W10_08730 [Plantactinospora sp. BB1]